MVGEMLIDLFMGVFRVAFGAIQFLELPTNLINTLSTILAYGNWVVGLDIMALFVGSVVFWWTTHLSIGLIVWVWNRLPFV